MVKDELVKFSIAQLPHLPQDSSPLAWVPKGMLEYVSGMGPGHIAKGSLECVGDNVGGFIGGMHVRGDGRDVVTTGGVAFLRFLGGVRF